MKLNLLNFVIILIIISCQQQQNSLIITDLKDDLAKIQQQYSTAPTVNNNHTHYNINQLNIFTTNNYQLNSEIKLIGIINTDDKLFAVIQYQDQSFIAKKGDLIQLEQSDEIITVTKITTQQICIASTAPKSLLTNLCIAAE